MRNTMKFHVLTIAIISTMLGEKTFSATTFNGTQYDTYKSQININNCTLRNIKYHTKKYLFEQDPTTGNQIPILDENGDQKYEFNNDGNSSGTFQFISNSNTCNIQDYLNPANQIEAVNSTGPLSPINPYTTQRDGSYIGEIYYADGSITQLTNNNGLDINIVKDISATAATDAKYLVFKTRRAGWAAIQVTGGSKFIIQDLTDTSLKRSLFIEQYDTNGHSLAITGGEADIKGDLNVKRTHTTEQTGSSRAIYLAGVTSKLNVGGDLNIAHLVPSAQYNNRESAESLEVTDSAQVIIGGNTYIYNATKGGGVYVGDSAKLDIKGRLELYMDQLSGQDAYIGIANNKGKINIGQNLKITGNEHTLISQSNGAELNIDGETLLTKSAVGNYVNNNNSTIYFNNKTINFVFSGVNQSNLVKNNGLVNTNNGQVYFKAANTSVSASDLDYAIVNSNNATIHFLADSSTVNGNINNINRGIITLQNEKNGSLLTVIGDYVGADGILKMDVDLGDDNSEKDFVIIDGKASGTTELQVNNINGLGAPTRHGIQIIQTNESEKGAFYIANKGYVSAGAHDYYLEYRQADTGGVNTGPFDNWYLMNYDYKDYIYTPDIGSYLAVETMGNMLFNSRLEDREGASQFQNLHDKDKGNVWVRAYGSHNQFKSMDSQLKTKGNSFVTQFGSGLVSLGEEDQYNLGVMGGLAYYNGKTHSNLTTRESKVQINGYSLGLYGTWYAHPVEERGAYIDSWVLWNHFRNNIDTPDQNTYKYNSTGVTASIEVGGDYLLNEKTKQNWWIQPQAQLIYQGVHADNFKDAQDIDINHGKDNIQARIGVKTYLNIPTNGNKLTSYRPYIALNYLHNTNPYSVTINNVDYVNEGSANQGEFKIGLEGHTTKNSQVWINAAYIAGSHDNQTFQGNVGWKYNF